MKPHTHSHTIVLTRNNTKQIIVIFLLYFAFYRIIQSASEQMSRKSITGENIKGKFESVQLKETSDAIADTKEANEEKTNNRETSWRPSLLCYLHLNTEWRKVSRRKNMEASGSTLSARTNEDVVYAW